MELPDILWIVTTQWRGQAFGYAGDPNARTPCLDALAMRGVNFTQAVTPHPFGPFARAAMLTGLPSPANGIREYFDPLPPGSRTIAHELRSRGYATAFLGKWHLAPRNPSAPIVGEEHARMIVAPGYRGGFDFWEGFESGFLLNDPWLHGTRLAEPARFTGYQADVLVDSAVELWSGGLRSAVGGLRGSPAAGSGSSRGDVPFPGSSKYNPQFLVVSLEAPHPPYGSPLPSGIVRPDPGSLVLRPNVSRGGEAEARARLDLAGYYAHIEATDRAIGRLLESVAVAAVADARRTCVVFTSVHGDMHGSHGLFRKGWPYEESVRVPLLIGEWGGPGSSLGPRSMGCANHAAVSLVDLPAMMLRIVEGQDLQSGLPVTARIGMPSVPPFPQQCNRAWYGIRTPTRKLVLNADGRPWLFFDLGNDPFEGTNLVGDAMCQEEITQLERLAAN